MNPSTKVSASNRKRVCVSRQFFLQIPLFGAGEGAQRPVPPQRERGGQGRAALPPSTNRGGKSLQGEKVK